MNALDRPNRPLPGLRRSTRDAMIAGVCAGIAEWLGWSPGLVRLAYVLLSILSAAFPGLLVYVLLWLLMPPRDPSEYLGD